MSENQINNNVLQKQAWDYFQMHAAQRLTTFNFYIVISSLITTALFSTLQKDCQFNGTGVILSLLLIGFSFIFWKLDGRNKELIAIAEASLKFFETNTELENLVDEPHVAKIFSCEEYKTQKKRIKNRRITFWKNHFSYSDCFNSVFLCFGILGTLVVLKLFILRV